MSTEHHEHEHNHQHEHNECSCEHEHNHEHEHHHHHEHHHEHDEIEIGCSCGCCHHDDDDDDEEDEITLKDILISGILFALALIIKNIPPVKNLTFQIKGISVAQALPLLLCFASYLICGLNVIKTAVKSILHGQIFNEQFLMAVASIGAICIGEYPEAVAVMLFYQVGEYFQDYAVGKSKASIKSLLNLRPDKAVVIHDGKQLEVHAEDVNIDELIFVKPGERIPLDGIITEGKSFADTSALTGESVPREIFEGCEVLAGFINQTGALTVKVTKRFSESSVSRILELVQHASTKKARTEKFITRFAKIYTPLVCFAAVLVAITPPIFTGAGWEEWITRALMFLVVSCPCALVISVPLSFFGGIGAASRNGILIKGSNYLELLSKARTGVFDKTGTLTKGVFVVTDIHPAENITREELIAAATHAEKYSMHPISKSLKAAHSCPLCDTVELKNVHEISGHGISVVIDGKTILAGNMKLMQEQKVTGIIPCGHTDSGTVVHVAIDGKYSGHILISDKVKEDSAKAIAGLKKLGIKKTVMLTGDSKDTADSVAKMLGIDEVHSELLPQDKVSVIESISKNGPLFFAGDGINDAPVLASADIGIAMGSLGSDAAIEAADVVIMTDEPSKINTGIKIARRTMNVARQNIIFALGVKILIMILAASGIANMWTAVFGDVGVAFLAVMNSLRLVISNGTTGKKNNK